MHGFPSTALLRQRAAAHAARTMSRWRPWLVLAAAMLFVTAAAGLVTAVAAAEHAMMLAERV